MIGPLLCPRCPVGSPTHGIFTATFTTPDGVQVTHRSKACGRRAVERGEHFATLVATQRKLREIEAEADGV